MKFPRLSFISLSPSSLTTSCTHKRKLEHSQQTYMYHGAVHYTAVALQVSAFSVEEWVVGDAMQSNNEQENESRQQVTNEFSPLQLGWNCSGSCCGCFGFSAVRMGASFVCLDTILFPFSTRSNRLVFQARWCSSGLLSGQASFQSSSGRC